MKDIVDKVYKGFFQKSSIKISLVLVMIVTLMVTLFDFSTVEVEANVQDFSMYNRASEIATAFGTDMAPSTDEDAADKSPWLDGNLNAGNAGGLLGYSRELSEDEEGIMGWITSRFSANSMTYNYSQLVSLGGSDSNPETNKLLAYGLYGSQLQSIGLINAGDIGLIQKGVSFVFSGMFWIAQLVPFIFNLILKLLVLLNPFQLFFGAFGLIDSLGVPFLSDISNMISSLYSIIQNISIVVTIPILIGMTAVSIFMFSGNAGKKVLRVFVRVFMIFAGLPLIAMTYTSVIEDLSDNMDTGGSFANYVILTQFVDSENWMKDTRLAPTVDNPITLKGSYPNIALLPSVSRETVLEINTKRVYGGSVLGDLSNVGTISDAFDHDDTTSFAPAQATRARELLNRYRSGDRFSASDYEGYLKAELDRRIPTADIATMFEPGVSDFTDHDAYGDMFEAEAGVGDFGDIQYSIYNFGSLDVVDDVFTGANLDANVSGVSGIYGVEPSTVSGHTGQPLGLSPLAMYNFLNTDFGITSMTVYSPETSASAWSSNDYASVSSANVGFFGFMYTLESMVLILGSVLLGLFYALGLIQIIISSLPRILSGVFGTAVGSLAMVTKLLVSTVVLILEIIGSMVMYMVFDGLLLSVLRSSETLISTLTSQSGYTALQAAGGLLKSAVVIILGTSIVFFAIKNRTKFAKMVEEVTTDLITKLMSGLDNSMNQGNMFHDGQGVGRAASAGTIHGADGKLGTEGSGAYAAKAASGQDPDGGFGMKDAIRETLGQEALKAEAAEAQGLDYEGLGKKGTAAAIADRYKDYKKASAKDAIAGGLGGLATGMTLAGISDLDGGARERLSDMEEAERRGISDMRRGLGANAFTANSADVDESTKQGMELSDADAPMGEEAQEAALANIENDSVEGVLESQDYMNDENTALEHDGGEINADQEEYGNVGDIGTTTQTDAYDDFDSNADDTLVGAVGEENADSVSLDDADSHPPYEPLSEEHDNYIDGLAEAAELQNKSVEHHTAEAAKMDSEVEGLQSKLGELENISDPTPAQQQEMAQLSSEINSLKDKSTSHKAQARKATRKAMKIDAKQQSALTQKRDALKDVAGGQSKPIAKAQELREAAGQLKTLEGQAESLESELNQMYSTGQTEGLAEKHEALTEAQASVGDAREKVQALQKEATQSIPQTSFESLHENTPEQNEAYRNARGMSEEKFQEHLQATPTSQQEQVARRAVAQTVNELAKVRGKNPQEIKQKQQQVLANSINDKYGSLTPQDEQTPKKMASAVAARETAAARVDQAAANIEKLKNTPIAIDRSTANAAQEELIRANEAYAQADNEVASLQPSLNKVNERKAYMQMMNVIQSDNEKRLDQKAVSRNEYSGQAARASRVSKDIENTTAKHGQAMIPKNAQVISGPRAEADMKLKEATMKSMGVSTPEQYQEKMESLNAGIIATDEKIEKEQKRFEGARRSSDTIKRNSISRRIGTLKKEREALVRGTQQERSKLQENVAGLYRNGIVPQNTSLTNGKKIKGDIGKVTHTAELLNVKLAELDKVPPREQLTPENQVRRDKLVKRIQGYQKQLQAANIQPRNLDSQGGVKNLVNELQQEYERIAGPKL